MAATPADASSSRTDETQPLLAGTPRQTSISDGKNSPLYSRVIGVLVVLLITIEIPVLIVMASSTRVFEMIYCLHYFEEYDPSVIGPGGSIEERLCKIPPVQSKVSTLNGNRQFFQNSPTIVIVLFVGLLADRIGRRPLIILNVFALTLRALWYLVVCSFSASLDLRLIWLEGVLALAGGGQMAAAALLFTVMSDVTAEQDRASTFFRVMAVSQLCAFLGPFIGAALLSIDPWRALELGVALHFLGLAISLALPETLSTDQRTSRAANPPIPPELGEPGENYSTRVPQRGLLKRVFLRYSRSLRGALGFLLSDWRILAMSSFYMFRYLFITLDLQAIQYISQRYSKTISDAAFFGSLQSFLCMINLLLVLPWATSHLTTRTAKPLSNEQKDVLFVRLGLIFTAIGWLVIGFAPKLSVLVVGQGILAFGIGTAPALRALVTTWVQPEEVGRLYGILAISETIGLTFGGPAVSQMYNAGLDTNQPEWYGLPWVALGATMTVVASISCLVRWTRMLEEQEDEGEEPLLHGVDPMLRPA